MNRFFHQTVKTALLRLGLILAFVTIAAGVAAAQQVTPPPADQKNTTDVLNAIDRLMEQNRQLVKQNQQLTDEITALRQALAAQSTAPPAESKAPEVNTSLPQSGKAAPQEQPSSSPTTGQSSSAQSTQQTPQTGSLTPSEQGGYDEPEMWGEWNPGPGFKVAKTKNGELNLSGYMVARYLNQLPAQQSAIDHLNRPIAVQARQDFQFHRIMLYTNGWLFDPKFRYYTFVWSVLDTAQVAVGGSLTYDFGKRFWAGIGVNPLPINRTVQGNHPYWPSYDRMMADEFFRPFFTQGIFGGGELGHRVSYKWMVGNNLSTLGAKATLLTRELNFGGSLTWMPTTGEFGPRGALGDFEDHQKLATRFGIGYGVSRENRQSNENDPANNTTIRLADSLNIFDTGAFADGVTVQKATYHMLASDVGFKKRGFWFGAEGYYRLLDNFRADGPLPVGSVRDYGFYAEATYMVAPKLVELYGGTSYVFSNFGSPKEFLVGGNVYPARNRNYRVNAQLINVDHSPVNSTFGFYMGQLKGPIFTIGVTAFY
jgi:hypothetical protein